VKLTPTPETASDALINALTEIATVPELFFSRMPNPKRAFDLHSEYTSFAPPNQRWSCIDLNTYDGAPDSEGCSTFIGRGPTEHDAKLELLELFAEYDQDLIDNPKPVQRTKDVATGHEEPHDYVTVGSAEDWENDE
jgi:hypothetical protein